MNIINSLLNVNFTPGREGHDIKYIVLHTMFGTVNSRSAIFRDPTTRASDHYTVALDGTISQWVSDADTALQTDNDSINLQAIGIEQEDNGNSNDSVRTDAMYAACAELVADLCKRYDIPCRLVEVDGNHMPVESGIILHSQVSFPTECPGALDSNRIVSHAQAILEPPAPEAPSPVVYEALPTALRMRVRDMANGGAELWDLTFRAWEDVKSVQHLNAGDEFDAVAVAHHPLGGKYYMNAEDYNNSGQSSDVPYKPWGANVDDLEDYPEEVQTSNLEPQLATESTPTSEVTSSPDQEPISTPEATTATEQVQESISEQEENVVEPEIDSQPATEPSQEQASEHETDIQQEEESSQADVSEPAQSETTASEPTPPSPQITYSELGTQLDLVTNKAPTNVYALDTETFAKITAVKELAEGTPFNAISEATVIDGDETTYYYVDDQGQAVREDDLQEAPAPQEQTISQEQIDTSDDDPQPATKTDLEPEPDPRATQKPLGENEGPVMMDVLPPKSSTTKWMKSYKDYDHILIFTVKGTHEVEDIEGKLTKQTLPDKMPINIVGHFEKDGQEYYLSEKCAYPKDEGGNPLPRVWLGILPEYLTSDSDVDNLSSHTIAMSNKEKVLAGTGALRGLLTRIYMKPKRGEDMILKALQDIINFLEAFNWPLIAAFLVSGPFLSGLSQIIKKNRQLESWGVIQTLVGTLSFTHTAILLWLTDPAALNMIPIYGPTMYAYTQPWYPLIKRADNWLGKFIADLNAKDAQASAAMSNAINNPVPMTSLPGESTPKTNDAEQTPGRSPYF
jgi:hypothetical protein